MRASTFLLAFPVLIGLGAAAFAEEAPAILCDRLAASPYAGDGGVAFEDIDPVAAIAACEAAVDADPEDPSLRFNLGRAYDAAGETDKAIAAYLESGTPLALYSLGVIHEGGYGVEPDAGEALRYYNLAVDESLAGDAGVPALGIVREAMGRMHEKGLGVEQDYERAAELYGEAIELGFLPASGSLGFLHENGWGVPKDETKALELYRVAADAGEAFAIHNVAVYHAEGRGGLAPDPARAAGMYSEAAALGWEPSILNLGLAYAAGSGVPEDKGKAETLFRDVIAGGGDLAAEAANSLAWMFANDPTNREEAEDLAWSAVRANPENANYRDTLAWVLHLSGKHAEALVHAEEAVRTDPKLAYLEHLDEIRLAIGD